MDGFSFWKEFEKFYHITGGQMGDVRGEGREKDQEIFRYFSLNALINVVSKTCPFSKFLEKT